MREMSKLPPLILCDRIRVLVLAPKVTPLHSAATGHLAIEIILYWNSFSISVIRFPRIKPVQTCTKSCSVTNPIKFPNFGTSHFFLSFLGSKRNMTNPNFAWLRQMKCLRVLVNGMQTSSIFNVSNSLGQCKTWLDWGEKHRSLPSIHLVTA